MANALQFAWPRLTITDLNKLVNELNTRMGKLQQVISFPNGVYIAGSYLLGDILYVDTVNSLVRLPGNITTTKQYLSQTGTGSVSAAPVWSQISFGDLSGSITYAQLPTGAGTWNPGTAGVAQLGTAAFPMSTYVTSGGIFFYNNFSALFAQISAFAPNQLSFSDSTAFIKQKLTIADVGKWIPGATSFSFRNNADNADNLLISDAGALSIRGPISGGTTLSQSGALTISTNQVVTSRQTGWSSPTGTFDRSAFNDNVTLIVLARHVEALIIDLLTHGLIGP